MNSSRSLFCDVSTLLGGGLAPVLLISRSDCAVPPSRTSTCTPDVKYQYMYVV